MKRGFGALLLLGWVSAAVGGCNEEDFVIPGLVTLTVSPSGPFTAAQTVMLGVTFAPEIESEGIAYVEFYERGQAPTCTDDTPPFECAWTVAAEQHGSHDWVARAYARDGRSWRSVELELVVDISGPRVQPPPTEAFGLIGTIPALRTARDLAVDRDRQLAYVASPEWGLAVIDIHDPADPVMLSGADVPFAGRYLAWDGESTAVVTQDVLGDKRAFVVDLSDPLFPRTLGSMEGWYADGAIQGRYAYLPKVTGALVVVDLIDPYEPVEVASVPISVADVDIVAKTAYALVLGGLALLDLSNPVAPSVRSTVDALGWVRDLDVEDGYAYVAALSSSSTGEPGGVHVIDVRDPDQPRRISTFSSASSHVSVEGARALIQGADRVRTLDLTDRLAPRELGALTMRSITGIEMVDGLAYFTSTQPIGIGQVLSGFLVAHIGAFVPSVVGNTCCEPYQPRKVAVQGSLAVIERSGRMQLVDVTDPTLPTVVGERFADTLDFMIAGTNVYSLEVSPNKAELVVTDVRVPSNPGVRGRVTLPGTLTPGASSDFEIAMHGSFVYVAATSSGLHVIDVSDPSRPLLRVSLSLSGSPTGVVASEGRAYVPLRDELVTVDVTDPDAPRILGAFPGAMKVFAVSGTQVYAEVQSTFNGLPILMVADFANPSAPTVVGQSGAVGFSLAGALHGDRLALVQTKSSVDPHGVVRLIDVSDPSRPTRTEDIVLPGFSRDIAAENGLFYATDDIAGIGIIRQRP